MTIWERDATQLKPLLCLEENLKNLWPDIYIQIKVSKAEIKYFRNGYRGYLNNFEGLKKLKCIIIKGSVRMKNI